MAQTNVASSLIWFIKQRYNLKMLSSVMIWAQTVCKGYQQTTKVVAAREELEEAKNKPTEGVACYKFYVQ